jgi:HSP20 family molecular chaperone IbpA
MTTNTADVTEPPTEQHPPPQHVPVNVWETTKALVVVAPMPGVTVDDVSVTLRHGRLRLAAELRTPAEKDYRVQEWLYGAYERLVDVGEGFGAPVTATLGNGVLAVSVARLAEQGDRDAVDDPGPVEIQPVAAGSEHP